MSDHSYGGVMDEQLSAWTSRIMTCHRVVSLHKNFVPLCLSSPRFTKGYRRHTSGGSPLVDKGPTIIFLTGGVGKFSHTKLIFLYIRLLLEAIFCCLHHPAKHFFLLANNLFPKHPTRVEEGNITTHRCFTHWNREKFWSHKAEAVVHVYLLGDL